MKTSLIVFLAVFSFFFQLQAAVPNSKTIFKNIVPDKGALQGGMGGVGFSLLKVKREISKTHDLEAVTLVIGGRAFDRIAGPPAFHHIERKGNLIILNIRQTIGSRMNEREIQNQFIGSRLIESVSTHFNSENSNLTLQFRLKSAKAQVRLGAIEGQLRAQRDSAIRLDFFNVGSAQKR